MEFIAGFNEHKVKKTLLKVARNLFKLNWD
jgi:hypothetical protein